MVAWSSTWSIFAMTAKLKHFITGIANVLDIYPSDNYSEFYAESPQEMMNRAWEDTGDSLRDAMFPNGIDTDTDDGRRDLKRQRTELS